MSTLVKVLLGIAIVGILLILLVVVGGYLWWQKGGGKEMGKAFVENAEKAEKEGREFGRNVDNEACIAEGLQRDRKDASISGAIGTQIFVKGCLKVSKETPGFCSSVPKPTQILDSPKWQMAQCQKRGAGNDQFCPQIMKSVQEHCYLDR